MAESSFAKLFRMMARFRRRPLRRARVRLQVEELENRLTPSNMPPVQTWVSGVGDDVNPGSRTAPDKTWAGAISVTQAGGIITALDSGGFGAVTITKAITLDGGDELASSLVSGTNGIVIAAGSSDVVVLRHLKLQGIGTGLAGIKIISAGEVHIEDCIVQNFTGAGIDFEPTNAGAQLFVSNTDLVDDAGGGVLVKPNGVAATASIDAVHALADLFGVRAEDKAQVSVSNSVVSGSTQNGFQTVSATNAVHMDLVNVVASNNGQNGVTAEGAGAQVSYTSLTAVGNSGQATLSATGGVITDLGNDALADNGRGFTPISLSLGGPSGGASRTWVSGVGDDANPDSRTAPGKTFAGAISKTTNAGEIDTLDPGGFGTVTITKSITIDGSGAFGGIFASGTNGITINVGATQVVILRGLSLEGLGQTGLAGIKIIQAGAVIIEDCVIKNFSGAGIDFEPTNDGAQLLVENTTVIDNAGGGILVKPNGVTARASIDRVQALANKFGVRVESGADAAVTNTVASGSIQNGFQIVAARMNLQADVADNNGGSGVTSEGAGAQVTYASLTAAGNAGQGTLSVTGGVLTALGSNGITDNGKGFTPITLIPETGGSRGWVSGVGDDANPASRTAPVATFASAVTKAFAGGEVDALDPGDFATVTISNSMTIDGGNNLAGVMTPGTDGIVINAAATDIVILRNLRLDGFGTGLNGIKVIQAGAVVIENCVIENFSAAGIDFVPTNAGAQLFVSNTQVLDNGGGGVLLNPNGGSASARVSLDHVDAFANKFGFRAEDNADVTISNSTGSGSTQNGFQTVSATTAAQMILVNDVASNNGQSGLTSEGAIAHVALSGMTVTGNSGAGSVTLGGGSFLALGINSSTDNGKGFTPAALALGSGGGPNSRSWVSGVGDDANPDNRTAPGQNFADAFTNKTTTGGEIDHLDPGDFGPVTITHSIVIDGTASFAGIQATSGNAITVSAGPTDVVILRGLVLSDPVLAAVNGIQITGAGAVIIEDCIIENFSGAGIDFEPTNAGALLFVSNTVLSGNRGGGILVKPNGVSATGLVTLDHVDLQGDNFGVQTNDNADTTVSNSRAAGSTADGFEAFAAVTNSVMTLTNVVSANNTGNGVYAQGPVAGSSVISATIYAANVPSTGNGGAAFLAASSSPADSFVINTGGTPAVPVLSGPANPTNVSLPLFTWSNTGADHYDLWLDDSTMGTSQVIRQHTLLGTTYTATTPLLSGHQYTAWLEAFNIAGQTNGWSQPRTFTVQLPAAPGSPTLTGPSGNSTTNPASITWNAPLTGTAAGYDLWVDDTTVPTTQFIRRMNLPALPTAFTTGNLTVGHSYQAWVRAFDNLGQFGAWSAPEIFTIVLPTPAVPTMSGPANPTNTALPTFTWNNTGADHYDLWVDDLTSRTPQVIRQTALVAANYPATTPLAAGHQYTAWVRAFALGQTNGWSPPLTFTVQLAAPPGSPSLSGPSGNINTLTTNITWNAGSGTPAGYDLWVDDTTAGTSQFIRQKNLPVAPTSFASGTLTVGHMYTAWVRAFDGDGQFSTWSTPEAFTVGTIPGTPALTPTGAITTSTPPTISWSAAGSAASYELYVADNTTGAFPALDQPGIVLTTASPALTEGHNYTVWVRAINNLGQKGNWSGSQTFWILLAVPVITAPNPSPTSTTPTISWTESTSGAVRYDLWVDDATLNVSQVIREKNLATTSFLVTTPLIHGHSYNVWVEAFDALGHESGWQSPAFVFSVT